MNISILIRPLIGATIGYITNWIAVKMMFRPLNPIKIGKFKLPFTPGIIPKNKERLAKSIGESISDSLLTEEALKHSLLSDETKENIREKIVDILNSYSENDNSIKYIATNIIDEESYNKTCKYLAESISESIYEVVKDSNLGDIIAEQIKVAADEKLNGSMLKFLGANSIVNSISSEASIKINEYIRNNGKELIFNMTEKEIEKISNTNISNVLINISNSEIDLISVVMNIYENVVLTKITGILNTINISKIVTDKINSMDILELEKLILDIMKKELNALVNLGAIIGLILGTLNLLF